MDLKNLTPKDKEMYEIAMERKNKLIASMVTGPLLEDDEIIEIIHHISRAEYKRGKADGIMEDSAKP